MNTCFRKNRGKTIDHYTIEPVSKRTGEHQQNTCTIQIKIELEFNLLISLNMHYYLYLKDTFMKMLGYLCITLVDHRHFLKK